MPKYSEQDLKYADELREEIHLEALSIVQKTRPDINEVIDRHKVEDYFQEYWDYPGQWYTVVAVPYGYGSRKALVDAIVRDTLSGVAPESESVKYTQGLRKTVEKKDDPFYKLLAEYPDLVVDYHIVRDASYRGYESHRNALKDAFRAFSGEWNGDPDKAEGKRIASEGMFSSEYRSERLNYRKAFLYPPHQNSYTGKDFARFNADLFPKGTDQLEVYEWTTDWSDYFDDGREWWGTLCLTVYDKSLSRFVVIMASATD